MTHQNAAMIKQSTAASRDLSSETDELARLVGRFRAGERSLFEENASSQRPSAQSPPTLKVSEEAELRKIRTACRRLGRVLNL